MFVRRIVVYLGTSTASNGRRRRPMAHLELSKYRRRLLAVFMDRPFIGFAEEVMPGRIPEIQPDQGIPFTIVGQRRKRSRPALYLHGSVPV